MLGMTGNFPVDDAVLEGSKAIFALIYVLSEH
jgi:hypothetical protein